MADTEEKQGSGIYEIAKDAAKSKSDYVKRWLAEIELASKEEEKWRKTSQEARDVYEAAESAPTGTAFNIYYANIETLRPALYNSTPIPDVRRRYGDRDQQAKEGADAIERCLSYSIDDYDFDVTIAETIDDLSITGRGVARVTLDEQLINEGGIEDVGAQSVGCEVVPWASFRRGPARTWAKVPWEAFAHYMTRDQLKTLSPRYGGTVKLDMIIGGDGEAKDGAAGDNPESDVFKRTLVWEIWDKATRKVIYIAPTFNEDVLAEVDDPLGLRDFFPTPRPMMTGKTSGRLVPLSPYKIYKTILDEIDTITKRINKLIKQLRPRALSVGGVDTDAWAGADDGEVVEVSKVMQFLESGGMEKLLAWFPMEPTIKAIEQLSLRFAQLKQDMFEVSGLADIMRGQSNAQETASAQEMKQRWGSLRLQKAQAEVQRFIRDLFRLKAEIIAEKFSPENIAMMTGLQMSAPAIALIKDDKMRGYRIDVETDSTIRGDLTRNQEAMAQFVQGSAQYFAAIAPIVQAGGMTKQAAVTIYSAFARNFKLGKEVDAVLDSLADEAAKADQAGPAPDPEVEKTKAQIAMQREKNAADIEMKRETNAMDIQHTRAKHGMEMQHMQGKMAMEKQGREQDIAFKKQQGEQDMAFKTRENEQNMQAKSNETQAVMMAKLAGKDGAGAKMFNDSLARIGKTIVAELSKASGEQQQQLAQLIAQSHTELMKAVTAEKSVETPDGRVYRAKSSYKPQARMVN